MLISTEKPVNKKLKLKIFLLSLGSLLTLSPILFSEWFKVQAHFYIGSSVLDHKIPVPGYRKPTCDQVADPEFHSLRPYQTAKCGDSPKTYFCWNNYNLLETVQTRWDPGSCAPDAGGQWQCDYMQDIEKVYTIDGEYARWPIMGNTEMVTNSQGP